MSSIEVWIELQELKKRVEVLEGMLRMAHDNIAIASFAPRKRPGPPKGYKRKVQPSA